MLQPGVYLICKFLAVDGTAAAAGAGGIAGLEHEAGDYAVETYGIVVAAAGECCEVITGLMWL